VTVTAGAAVGLTKLASWCAGEGCAGFEFAAGIPGTVGGAVVVNAGAWGRAMADVVDSIRVVDHEKSEIVRAKNLAFRYRRCEYPKIEKRRSVITEVVLNLIPGEPDAILTEMQKLQVRRKERQPHGTANAGSVFKNPEGAGAGKLIEDAGLKGLRIGDAEVSRKHANFIINRGNATARDVRRLIAEVQERVRQQSGIELEPEIEILEAS